MEPFSQDVVNAPGLPTVLYPRFFKLSKDFANAVDGALARSHQGFPILGIAHLITAGEAALEALAVATDMDEIFVLYPRSSPPPSGQKDPAANIDALSSLLLGEQALLVGFGMARIAMHIRHGLNVHLRGIELSEAAPPKERNASPGIFVKNYLDVDADMFGVNTLWDAEPTEMDIGVGLRPLQRLALCAWLTAKVAATPGISQGMNQCVIADTRYLDTTYFKIIQQMLIEVEQMEAAKPRLLENTFRGTTLDENGNIVILNERFGNRVRPNQRAEVHMRDVAGRIHRGIAKAAQGKETRVAPRSNLGGLAFTDIYVVGKDDLNNADRAREAFLLGLLQGKHDLRQPKYDLLRKLYFPDAGEVSLGRKVVGAPRLGRLNQSQADVVDAMVNSDVPFIVVHGPPGTGKTSTISAAVQYLGEQYRTVWVVAQSNVAVKNIAERLAKDEVPFKLLVSKEFYHEWHEHIYKEVEGSLIRTDELPAQLHDIEIMFHGTQVVLCTMSTLSNPSLDAKSIFRFVPLTNLIVDEASQIGIFNYMHILAKFKHLEKVCFFGDPKQLPPYGKESAITLQSVFDVRLLKSQSYFLNTQYRMPVPIGSFISDAVYDGKLRSEHRETSSSCIAFIDVSLGYESKDKTSFVNSREVQTIEHLVGYYYRGRDYCIITPYDAQRNAIQKALEAASLQSDNVYNVDSFQGNEADYIIVSVVRSELPGFLSSKSRVNVMLTRCKKGMVIVTSQNFMRKVQNTLLGGLHAKWTRVYGKPATWRDWKDVAERTADLPGVSGTRRKWGADVSARVNEVQQTSRWGEEEILRSNNALAPINTRASAPLNPYIRHTSNPLIPGRNSDWTVRVDTDPGIESLNERFQRATLGPRQPSIEKSSSQYPFPPSDEAIGTMNRKVENHRAYGISFPKLSQASQPTARPVASGAWRKGPPHSSPAIRSSGPFSQGIRSQKLSALYRKTPVQTRGVNQNNERKWESWDL